MRQTIGLMAACAALLAGCTNEVGEGLGIDTPIQVTANVEGIMTTRAENTEGNLDNFGLSIKDGQSYTGNYAGENILAEKDNGTWTLSKTVLYQGSGQTYYAYAPYKEGHTGESLTFTVDADQATKGLQGSDLLHAAGKVESAKLDITLAHKLSKLTVTVTKKGETSPIEVGDVTLRGTVPTATLDLTNGDVEASDAATSEITMWKSSTGIYECILVPQATAFGVSFTYGGDTYLWESSSFTFEGGNAYTLALTFDQEVSAGEVTVSEWGKPEDDLGEGTATETNYTYDASTNTYTVYTAKGLQEWAEAVGSNNETNCTLAANIDMTGQTWQGANISYSGTFVGNGHTITGLTDCLLQQNYGTVRNLTLVEPNVNVTSSFNAGAVTGENGGTIENCHVVGGSVASGNGFIPPIISVGGIAGVNNNKIRACSSSAAVTAIEGDEIGGIVGDNKGSVLACYATGSVTGNGADIGAIAGRNSNTTTTCYWWSGNTAQGVGEGTDNTTKVTDGDWTAAMTAMNTALSGTGYRWIENTGDDKEDHPLIITNE